MIAPHRLEVVERLEELVVAEVRVGPVVLEDAGRELDRGEPARRVLERDRAGERPSSGLEDAGSLAVEADEVLDRELAVDAGDLVAGERRVGAAARARDRLDVADRRPARAPREAFGVALEDAPVGAAVEEEVVDGAGDRRRPGRRRVRLREEPVGIETLVAAVAVRAELDDRPDDRVAAGGDRRDRERRLAADSLGEPGDLGDLERRPGAEDREARRPPRGLELGPAEREPHAVPVLMYERTRTTAIATSARTTTPRRRRSPSVTVISWPPIFIASEDADAEARRQSDDRPTTGR